MSKEVSAIILVEFIKSNDLTQREEEQTYFQIDNGILVSIVTDNFVQVLVTRRQESPEGALDVGFGCVPFALEIGACVWFM